MAGVCFEIFQTIYSTKNPIDSRPDSCIYTCEYQRVGCHGYRVGERVCREYIYNYCDRGGGGDSCGATAGEKTRNCALANS